LDGPVLTVLLLYPQMQSYSDPNAIVECNKCRVIMTADLLEDHDCKGQEAPTSPSPARKLHPYEIVYTPHTPQSGNGFVNNLYLPRGHGRKYSRNRLSIDNLEG